MGTECGRDGTRLKNALIKMSEASSSLEKSEDLHNLKMPLGSNFVAVLVVIVFQFTKVLDK